MENFSGKVAAAAPACYKDKRHDVRLGVDI